MTPKIQSQGRGKKEAGDAAPLPAVVIGAAIGWMDRAISLIQTIDGHATVRTEAISRGREIQKMLTALPVGPGGQVPATPAAGDAEALELLRLADLAVLRASKCDIFGGANGSGMAAREAIGAYLKARKEIQASAAPASAGQDKEGGANGA